MCTIPKLFPYGEFLEYMKLTRTKLIETIRRKNEGWTTYQARKIARVGIRRVNQVWRAYLETGGIPVPARLGRPCRPLQDQERNIVKETYTKYRVSASMLERLIERDHGKHIGHNRIHKILLEAGLAKKGTYMQRKKKWIRYERRHSLTAVHIDWHQRPNDGYWVFAVEDDASRAILAMTECNSPTTQASIECMKQALQHGPIQQCISDHGAQFTSNNGGTSEFRLMLDANSIKPILCRIKHPQSNGKVEKWFHTYEQHRDAFLTIDQFIHWYNHTRPHHSLNISTLETPWQAFQRKMRC
jgi:putative transposase